MSLGPPVVTPHHTNSVRKLSDSLSEDPTGDSWESSHCPFNTIADPPGSTPMYQVVEEYADSNEKFFSDFFPVLEKMLMNGYDASDLVVAPMASHECPYQDPHDWHRYYSCS